MKRFAATLQTDHLQIGGNFVFMIAVVVLLPFGGGYIFQQSIHQQIDVKNRICEASQITVNRSDTKELN